MRIIEKVSDRIGEEIADARTYALMALETRDDHPDLSRTLYTISVQEMEHMRMLHEAIANVIMKYRQEKGEPPEKMMAVYEYLHGVHIAEAAEARNIQAMYK